MLRNPSRKHEDDRSSPIPRISSESRILRVIRRSDMLEDMYEPERNRNQKSVLIVAVAEEKLFKCVHRRLQGGGASQKSSRDRNLSDSSIVQHTRKFVVQK